MTRPAIDDPFRSAAAAYLAGLGLWPCLVGQAVELLKGRATVPASLVELASSGAEPRRADALALTERALADLGLPAVGADELSRMRVGTGLRDIAAGRVNPVESTWRLWIGREADGDPYEVLPDLIQLVDRWESHLDERAAIEERIRTIAHDAVDG